MADPSQRMRPGSYLSVVPKPVEGLGTVSPGGDS